MHKVDVLPMYGKRCLTFRAKTLTALRWSNTRNKLLQLANETLLRSKLKSVVCTYLPPTSKIVTHQNFVVASWFSMLRSKLNWNLLNFNKFISTCNATLSWTKMSLVLSRAFTPTLFSLFYISVDMWLKVRFYFCI